MSIAINSHIVIIESILSMLNHVCIARDSLQKFVTCKGSKMWRHFNNSIFRSNPLLCLKIFNYSKSFWVLHIYLLILFINTMFECLYVWIIIFSSSFGNRYVLVLLGGVSMQYAPNNTNYCLGLEVRN